MKKNNKITETRTHRLSDRAVKLKSAALKGQQIAVAVCGGVASVEVVKIIRELRRYQASVTAFFTQIGRAHV